MMFGYHRRSTVSSFIKGAVLGGLALGTTALLCAPSSGKRLRKDLKRQYRGAAKRLQATKKAVKSLKH